MTWVRARFCAAEPDKVLSMQDPSVHPPARDSGSWSRENIELSRLLERAATGCHESFEELYVRTSRWLLFEVRRWVGERDAEDVLAEIFIQLWRDACRYDPARAPATAWMAVIAKSRAHDHYRRRHGEAPCAVLDDRPAEHTPETLLARQQEQRLVHDSLARAGLNSREREVLCMAYFADRTQQQISVAAGMPLGTVKTTMREAQRKLRDYLAPVSPASAPARESATEDAP